MGESNAGLTPTSNRASTECDRLEVGVSPAQAESWRYQINPHNKKPRRETPNEVFLYKS